MPRAAAPDPLDPTDVRSRMRSIRAGVWLSMGCAASGALYYVLSWDEPHRLALLSLVTVVFFTSPLLLALPLERILRSRHREAFFLAWSAACTALLCLVAIVDGGDRSPLVAALVLPLVYAALSYPLRSTIAVGVMVVGGYFVVAASGGEGDIAYMAFWATTLGNAAWMCAWQARSHDRHRAALARVSRADPLTGCLNRRGFGERLEAELHQAARSGLPVGLIVLDLDHFKATNDRQGHAAGDALLRWTVATATATLRPMDALGRTGGDEFAVIVPGAGHAETAEVAERLGAALAPRAPASYGIASFPSDGIDADELHQRADVHLYAMKHTRERPAGHELGWAAALAHAVDQRTDAGHGHAGAVGRYAALIAERLGWDPDRVGRLRLAAMLHDVGKVAVPDAILRKPGELTDEEIVVVRRHSEVGAQMVGRVEGMGDVAAWIRAVHEHVDGSGYPSGLRGEAIPLESRILLLADAYDAMTSHRPYRRAMAHEPALAELRRCAGTQFDPALVEQLTAALDEQAAQTATTG